MSILLNSNSRIVVQIETDAPDPASQSQYPFFASNLVSRISLGASSGNDRFPWLTQAVPVHDTAAQAVAEAGANVALVMATRDAAVDAALDAIAAEIPVVVMASGDLPQDQSRRILTAAQASDSLILGPEQPEIVTPGACQIGALPGYIFSKGQVGVLSESGALVSEVALQTSAVGRGQDTAVRRRGAALDPRSFARCLESFLQDEATAGLALVLDAEQQGWREVISQVQLAKTPKPVVAHVAVSQAAHYAHVADPTVQPLAPRLAARQEDALRAAGIRVVESPARIGWTMKSALDSRRAGRSSQSGYSDFAQAMRRVEEEIYGTP